jgi:hypothetical protein
LREREREREYTSALRVAARRGEGALYRSDLAAWVVVVVDCEINKEEAKRLVTWGD